MPAVLDCVCVAAWGRRVVLSVVGLPGEASKASSISLERATSSDCDDASLDNKASGVAAEPSGRAMEVCMSDKGRNSSAGNISAILLRMFLYSSFWVAGLAILDCTWSTKLAMVSAALLIKSAAMLMIALSVTAVSFLWNPPLLSAEPSFLVRPLLWEAAWLLVARL